MANADQPLIHLDGITKVYRMGEVEVRALAGVTLDVLPGEFVAIMGSSGSGKSTLLNVIGCLDQPTSGEYRLDGVEVSRMNRRERARVRNRVIGFVFQNFNLLARSSALENVELPLIYAGMPRRERLARAREALERVGLGARVDHQPTQLSGGQQQRVALARAIVTRPRLILADEPTGNLDSQTSAEVVGLLQALGQAGITVVMVTHEPDVAEYASRKITVRDGRINADVRQQPRLAGTSTLHEAVG